MSTAVLGELSGQGSELKAQSPSGKATKEPAVRIRGLDALRGIAAMGVVLFHYCPCYAIDFGHPRPLRWTFSLGGYGVPLFFMISGFVILMTLDRSRSTFDFAVARFARLYPTFWTCVILTFVGVRTFALPNGIRGLPLAESAWNLTMMPKFAHWAREIDTVYWTLEVELFFYLMIGLIVAVGFRRWFTWILGALIGVLIIYSCFWI